MFHKQNNPTFKSKFLNLLLISPLILFSIPFFTNINNARAGLEFQWNQDSGFRRLKWFQKQTKKGRRNKIYFFLRPSDRKTGLLKINLAVPKTLKRELKPENITLCKVRIGGFETRTKCMETIPADVEIEENNNLSLNIYPYSPIPANKDNYAIKLETINPNRKGLYQFHSYGQYSGDSVSSYLGSWTIVID